MSLLGGAAALPQAVAAPTVDWALAVLLLWLAGAAAHLTWHVVGYQRYIRGALGAQAPLHILDGIAVHAADVAGPAAALRGRSLPANSKRLSSRAERGESRDDSW